MRTYSLIVICVLLTSWTMGQGRISLPFTSAYDEDASLLLGIQYNYVNQNYQLTLKEDWQNYPIDYPGDNINDLGALQSIHTKNSHGFSVSLPVDLRVNPNLYINFSPSFLFVNNSGIQYTALGDEPKTLLRRMRHSVSSTTGTNFNTFEFPLSIKYRSDEKTLKNKFNRYRAYILGGVRLSRFVGIDKEYTGWRNAHETEVTPHPIILKSQYPSWDVGLGVDIFFPYFKVSPELRFNQSFGSVLDTEHKLSVDNPFVAPLQKALMRNIYFSLIFQ